MQTACFPSPAGLPSPGLKALIEPRMAGMVTAVDFAAETGMALRTVQKLAKDGRLDAIWAPWCHMWLICESEVRRFASMQGVAHE